MKAILVVSTTGLGDCLWGTPGIRALKKSFPEAEIDVLTNPRWKSVFYGNPYVSNLFDYHHHWYRQPLLGMKLFRKKYDTVLIFHSNRDFRRLLPWVRTSTVWGHQVFPWIPEEYLLDFKEPVHGIQRRLTLIEKIGAKSDGPHMDIFLSEQEKADAQIFLKANRFLPGEFIYVNVGASLPHKRWPIDRFIELSKHIQQNTPFKVILGGGPEDSGFINSIEEQLDPQRTHHSFHRSIRANCALIGQSRLLVTTDTGPMHIGFALKVPTIALFGPTLPQESGPFHVEEGLCQVVQAYENRDARMKNSAENCFDPITVSPVWEKVEQTLAT